MLCAVHPGQVGAASAAIRKTIANKFAPTVLCAVYPGQVGAASAAIRKTFANKFAPTVLCAVYPGQAGAASAAIRFTAIANKFAPAGMEVMASKPDDTDT